VTDTQPWHEGAMAPYFSRSMSPFKRYAKTSCARRAAPAAYLERHYVAAGGRFSAADT
jgi:hypothetical protein